MKIVRINHFRCNEQDCSTYLVASDDLTKEKLLSDIEKAKNEYLENIRLFENNEPEPKYLSNDIASFNDNITIAQAKENYKNNEKARQEWRAKQEESTKTFEHFMCKYGYRTINSLGDDEILEEEVSWGHRHGITLRYGNEEEL